MKKVITGFAILILALTVHTAVAQDTLADLTGVRFCGGPAGCLTIQQDGSVLYGNMTYMPTPVQPHETWARAKWRGPEGSIYLDGYGCLVTSWPAGGPYCPEKKPKGPSIDN